MKETRKEPLVIPIYKVEEGNNATVRIDDEAMLVVKQAMKEYGISAKTYVSKVINHYAGEIKFKEVE